MAKSPEELAQTMIDNLQSKTGKALPEWIAVVKASGLEKHGQVIKHLKSEHGITHGFANLIAHKAKAHGLAPVESDDLVVTQYAGAKEGLRPIYDALVKLIESFGDDVALAPKKSYVSLRRNKQFGLIQPSTKTRVDVGINLKGIAPTDRLEASGSFNGMVSHRVRLSNVQEVDDELVGWLRDAYEAS
ncbi:MAG: DUF4287 domain-containing protein [Rhodothermales bacterium]